MIKNNKQKLPRTIFAFVKMKLTDFILAGVIVLSISIVPIMQGGQGDKWTAPQNADKLSNPVKTNSQSLATGRTLYNDKCSACHGKKGNGDSPVSKSLGKVPADFTSADFARQSDGAIFWKISEGRKPMPSFKNELTVEQRWSVVTFIREFAKGASITKERK
jgi:mono/diheme cytochrome c family protein